MHDREINRFIKAVTKGMGWKQRKEVKNELRAHILDSAEALAAERKTPVDDSIIREVIRKMGPPEEIAAMYPAGKKHFLFDKVILACISIFMIFFVIIAVMTALVAWQADHVEHREDATSHAGAGKIDLVLNNDNGKVDVIESETGNIEVIYDVSANQGYLGDVVTNTTYVQDGDTLKVKSWARVANINGFSLGNNYRHADVLVRIPKGSQCQLDLTTSYGDVTVAALNDSSLIVDSGNGGIKIDGGEYGRIDARTSYGAITMNFKANTATFKTGNGDINLDRVQATESLSATTGYGGIHARYDATNATFKSGNGDIDLDSGQAAESLSATTDYGRISATYNANKATFKTNNGDIDLDSGAAAESLSATTGYGGIHARYDATHATFETNNGNIDLSPDQTTGDLSAVTDYGPVHVVLPGNALFSVDASTSYGRIIHDSVPLVMTMADQSHIVGYSKDGPGTLNINLRSGNGNIEISY